MNKNPTSSVLRARSSMALLWHGYEVQGSVEAAWQLREIHVESKFIPDKIKHLCRGEIESLICRHYA